MRTVGDERLGTVEHERVAVADRRERMPPNASEPLSGSVIAHAPIFLSVSKGSAHRSRCSGVPFLMALPARFIDTPIAVTSPGQCRQNSTIGSSVITARSYRSSVVNGGPAWFPGQAFARHLVDSERPHVRPQQVVRRKVAVLEFVPQRDDFTSDEFTHRFAHPRACSSVESSIQHPSCIHSLVVPPNRATPELSCARASCCRRRFTRSVRFPPRYRPTESGSGWPGCVETKYRRASAGGLSGG